MRPSILCYERLCRIRRVLVQLGGTSTIRDLGRSYAISAWEIEQATQLGWLTVTLRKPRTGRPSRVVEFCGLTNAKFPPSRCRIEREISFRHWGFALRSVTECVPHGMRGFHRFSALPGLVSAYIGAYHPRSRKGAYASTSRLLRREDVQAARQWFYAVVANEIPREEPMPRTASGIWNRLRELGSWRANYC